MTKIGIIGAGTKIYYDIVQSDPENVGISGFTAHYLRMADKISFLLNITYFNTSDSILETHSSKVSMYALQSSILHSQIKILGTSPKKFGDIRIYPLTLLRQSIKTIKS